MQQKIVRAIVFSITGLVVLVVVALGVFVATFDPNRHLDQIGDAVKKATGRELRIEGQVEVTLFPKPGIKISRALLLDDPAFGEAPLLDVEQASLSIALESLFDDVLTIEEVAFSGARLKLARDRDGRGNWEAPPKPSARPPEAGVTALPDPAGQTTGDASSRKRLEARIDHIRVTELAVSYHDERNKDSFSLTVDSLELRDVLPGADIPLQLAGTLRDNSSGRQGAFSLDASARISTGGDISATITALRLVAEGFAEESLTIAGAARLNYEKEQGRLSLTDISASISLAPQRTSLEGDLSWQAPGDSVGQTLSGTLRLGDLDLDAWLARLRAPMADADGVKAGGATKGAPNLTRPQVAGHGSRQHETAQPDSGRNTAAIPSPVGLNVDLALALASLTIEGLPLQEVTLSVRLRDGKAEVPYTFRIYNGTVNGVCKANLGGKTPTVALDCAVKNLDLGRATAGGKKGYSVTGLLDASLDVTGQGLDAQALLRSLKGKASAKARGGEIRGFSLIPPDLRGLKSVPVDFAYTSMSASAVINEGTATSRDISLVSTPLTGRGGGVARLAFRQLDIGIDFMLAGLPPAVPVGISGPFNSLSASVDMRTFLRNVAEAGVKKPEEAVKGVLRGIDGLLRQ